MLCFRLMAPARALALSALIALCAPSSALAEEQSRIYVYAVQLTAAHSWVPISCGGVVVAELKRGMFFAISAPPGRYTLAAGNGVPAMVDIRPEEEVFVRLDWRMESGRPDIPVLVVVRPDLGRKQMNWLSYLSAKKIFSNSVSKKDPREPAQLRLKRR